MPLYVSILLESSARGPVAGSVADLCSYQYFSILLESSARGPVAGPVADHFFPLFFPP